MSESENETQLDMVHEAIKSLAFENNEWPHLQAIYGWLRENKSHWHSKYEDREVHSKKEIFEGQVRRVLNTKRSDSLYFGEGAKTALGREQDGPHDIFVRIDEGRYGIRSLVRIPAHLKEELERYL